MHTYSVADVEPETVARIAFADDHRMVAEGIERLLADEFDLVSLASDGRSLLEVVRREKPDLVLSDVNMPHGNGLDVLKELRAEGNMTPFVFLTMHAEPALAAAAMRAGANGYVLKLSAGEDLVNALHQVLAGGTYVTPSLGARYLRGRLQELHDLTAKQREVLRLVGRGLRSKQIAAELGLSVRTVEAHKYTMMQILDVHSTLELVRRSEDLGLLF
ncbi:DNA-binding NarL/FixJ family response regulator [Luteibacter sp. Sphag1AF]|uniref:response regulator n=1 Tax=Luteibacter sp. Sphag1AF TaxID=2587031 RepID=UPI00160B6B85|nr:response regulator transcription factor [Luteibacter sp. Sphag1AF]MBB3228558.1 DNA-binding NarL/FixJ family response regulator [Luteibacter sp. Sphag1AF]